MRKAAVLVALVGTALASPALARNGAWYVGGDFGAMIVEDVDFNLSNASSRVDNAVRLDNDYGFDGSAFVGYDLGAFRIEAEVAYKRARLDKGETIVSLPGTTTLPDAFGNPRGDTSALSFMVNGMLDFGDDDGISGFVGGGAGIARVSYNNLRTFSNQAAIVDDSDTRFAWQVVAGVRQAVSRNIDVTLRYRFFNVDNVRTAAFDGDDIHSRFRSHSLLGGITFNFGAPPPPPPPPPPEPGPPPPPPPPVVAPGPFIVFFDWDRDEITAQAAAILDNAAAAFAAGGTAQVVIAGHADRSGSADYNMGLSQRRANNARAYLAGRGVPDGQITTEAFGESRPLVDTADGVREPQNRRVEISFGPGS